jgi:hypothetical protein
MATIIRLGRDECQEWVKKMQRSCPSFRTTAGANDTTLRSYTGTGVLSTISWMTCSACSDFFRVEE